MTHSYDATAFRDVFENHFTYEAGFRRNTHRYADRPALTDGDSGRSWTYAQLGADANRIARGLLDRGVRPGQLVSYQLFNQAEFALTYLSAQTAGLIGSPINFRLAPGETAFILDDSQPAVFIYDVALTEQVTAALALARHRPSLLVAVGEAPAWTDR
jgi:acyl-CoA synthetase (AMP-forming)/AMP-acid ligase II